MFMLVFASCQDDTEDVNKTNRVEAKFTAGISTRVVDARWDVDDAIGITMIDQDGARILEDVFNHSYYTSTQAGDFHPKSSADIVYFPQNGDRVLFKSYYPYRSGLQRDLRFPITVADQTDLPAIDFMSAEHLSGFTKDDRDVSLRFHHRLTKVEFLFTVADGVEIFPEDIALTLKGMKTTGTYDLFSESLTVNDDSTADIEIPNRGTDSRRVGIVLPRPAGPGVSFDLTTSGGSVFSADMDEELALKPGYKYLFHITLEGTSMSVRVTIKDWIEGPTTNYDILGISTPAGESIGVQPGDQMQVYMKNGNAYQPFRLFTYGDDGLWTTPSPVFWEDIEQSPLDLRASLIPREPARNETQIPDYILADEISVERNTGADFTFKHVGSRVKVVLKSNIFTQEELNDASIILPSYFVGGREEQGVFVPGTARGNVIVDKTDLNDQFAIIQPQSVSPGANIVTVTVNGRELSARATNDGFLYEAGVAYELVITVNASDLSVSARVIDWVYSGPHRFDVLDITPILDETEGVEVGDQMEVFVKNGNDYEPLRTFTYGADGRWTTPNPVFWEDVLQDPLDLRASLIPREPAKNDTQIPDIILTDELSVPRNQGANFVFKHVGSRVKVVLQSNVFTQEQLNEAPIVLPSYFIGGREELGAFIPGTTRGNIIIDSSDLNDRFAIIQPQSVSPDGALVRMTLDGREFTARATDAGFSYDAGVSYELIIMVNESDVSVSARVIDWVPSGPHNFTILEVTPSLEDTEGVEVGARMTVYKNETNIYNPWTTFTYAGGNNWRPDTEVYWEQVTGDYADLRASIIAQDKLNQAQIDDILIANDIRVPVNTGADFVFNHVGSRLVVALLSDTFTDDDLNGATITMPQYITGGYEERGQFIPGQIARDIPLVRDETTNNSIAIIQPQTIQAGNNIFKVRIGTRDYWAKAPQGGFTYAPGVSYAITIHVNEENLTVSAQVIPWTQTQVDLNAFTVGTNVPGASSGVDDRAQMNVYMAQGAGRTLLSTFTYSQPADSWTASPVVYWEGIPSPPPAFYSSILVQPKLDPTQLDDYLIADPITPTEGEPVNFTLRHPAAKVVVQLRSSDDTFSPSELAAMVITLPDYITGGQHNNGVFEFPQDNPVGTINVPVINNNATAIIRPQTIVSRPVVNIFDPVINRNYPVTASNNIEFSAGQATTLVIDMRKTSVEISANAIPWTAGAGISLVAPSVEITGSLGPTSSFFEDRTIYAYKLGTDFRSLVYNYTPNGNGSYTWRGTQTLYWDDLDGQSLNITGVYYPEQAPIPSLSQNNTVFAWNLPGNQSAGYAQYDLLMSSLSLDNPSPVNFNFTHVLSKVRVRVVAPEFTPQELEGMNLTLNNFVIDGSASLSTGVATGTSARKDIIPYYDESIPEYSALVMPQTISAGTSVVTIVLPGYPNVPFVGNLDGNLTFVAGKENVITITLQKTGIQISATLEDWTEGPSGSITIQ